MKQNLKITINKVNNIKRGRTVTISGKFMDANGKILMNSNLKVKLNRKTVTVRTNKMGVYTYKAKVSSIGTNYITVSHDGNINYNKKSVQTTFKVTR